jgi:predicted DNA-binding protein with PD1-like motif
MDWKASGSDIFLRIDPGEFLIDSMVKLATALDVREAAVTSGVGMLMSVELGFFDAQKDDYERTRFEGIYDVNSILGNVTRREGVPTPHIHIVFNDMSHVTYSGHVIEAQSHLTMELFLSRKNLGLERVKAAGRPATRIELA